MKTKTFTISEAIKIVSEAIILKCRESGEFYYGDSAMIRTGINDLLDFYEKDGFKVNHEYDQERAVKIVKNKVKKDLSNLFNR